MKAAAWPCGLHVRRDELARRAALVIVLVIVGCGGVARVPQPVPQTAQCASAGPLGTATPRPPFAGGPAPPLDFEVVWPTNYDPVRNGFVISRGQTPTVWLVIRNPDDRAEVWEYDMLVGQGTSAGIVAGTMPDLSVFSNGVWSCRNANGGKLISLVVPPRTSVTLSITWPGTNLHAIPAPAGTYDVILPVSRDGQGLGHSRFSIALT